MPLQFTRYQAEPTRQVVGPRFRVEVLSHSYDHGFCVALMDHGTEPPSMNMGPVYFGGPDEETHHLNTIIRYLRIADDFNNPVQHHSV